MRHREHFSACARSLSCSRLEATRPCSREACSTTACRVHIWQSIYVSQLNDFNRISTIPVCRMCRASCRFESRESWIQLRAAVSISRIWKRIRTCMFHVLGRWIVVVAVAALWPFACFVCCMIWLIKSSCWRVNPSLFVVVAVNVVVPLGELGEGDFELIAVIVFPSPFIWYCMQVAPCGELASPLISDCDKDGKNWSRRREREFIDHYSNQAKSNMGG